MLFQKKKPEKLEYDKEREKPILKCSICNGEQVAGFKDLRTGKIREVMFIRNEKELQSFMERCDIHEVTREY